MRRPDTRAWWSDRFLTGLLAAFLLVHVALAVLMPNGAARMLLGDRAGDRVRALDELFAQADLDGALRVIFRVGSPGDWLLFAPAYRLAGSYGVMAQSMAFYALGLVLLYRLCGMLASRRVARIATIAWALLPATVFHPHAFVTEAICNPLLICLTYLLSRLELSEDTRWRDLILAGLVTAVLAFVRHIYLLLPLAGTIWLLLFRPHGLGARRNAAVFLALGFVLIAAWWGAIALGGQRYELGRSIGGLEANLYLRADRMAVMGGIGLPQSYQERKSRAGQELGALDPPEFIGFVKAHPVLFAKTVVSDAFNLIANPGVAMLAGRYFGLFDLGERTYRDLNKWREAREREGPLGVARLLWQTSPTGLVFNVAGGMLWMAFLGLATIGAWRFARNPDLTPTLRVLLFGIAGYVIILTSGTAGYTRWDHRSGIEFILALWFALGWVRVAAWWSGRRDSNSRLPAPKAGALPG
jgi:4-amino-4-deoxy-L-arabinose transferase-like glycosyltransferase